MTAYAIDESTVQAAIIVALVLGPTTRRQIADWLLLPDHRVHRHLRALDRSRIVQRLSRRGGAAWMLRAMPRPLRSVHPRRTRALPLLPTPSPSTSWWITDRFYDRARERARECGWDQ